MHEGNKQAGYILTKLPGPSSHWTNTCRVQGDAKVRQQHALHMSPIYAHRLKRGGTELCAGGVCARGGFP